MAQFIACVCGSVAAIAFMVWAYRGDRRITYLVGWVLLGLLACGAVMAWTHDIMMLGAGLVVMIAAVYWVIYATRTPGDCAEVLAVATGYLICWSPSWTAGSFGPTFVIAVLALTIYVFIQKTSLKA